VPRLNIAQTTNFFIRFIVKFLYAFASPAHWEIQRRLNAIPYYFY